MLLDAGHDHLDGTLVIMVMGDAVIGKKIEFPRRWHVEMFEGRTDSEMIALIFSNGAA